MNSYLMAFAMLPFLLQGLAIAVDEFYFHHKRGLPRWERLGHPLDTLSVTLGFLFLIFVPFSAAALVAYIGLAGASCLFVTKDEWVHAKHCSPAEMWLHSILFLLHPLVFVVSGAVWTLAARPELVRLAGVDVESLSQMKTVIVIQCFITVVFAIYQVAYWILYEPRTARARRSFSKEATR